MDPPGYYFETPETVDGNVPKSLTGIVFTTESMKSLPNEDRHGSKLSEEEIAEYELWSLPDSLDFRAWGFLRSLGDSTFYLQRTILPENVSILTLCTVLIFILANIFILRYVNNTDGANMKSLQLWDTNFEWNRKCMNFRIVASLETCESHLDDIPTWYE